MTQIMHENEKIDPESLEIWTYNLTKFYGKAENQVKAVNGIDIYMKKGVHGFLGPNGAGKTTTMRMLTGSLRPTRGSARISGFDVVNEGVQARQHIGYVPEENSAYYSDTTVRTFCKYIATLKGLSGTRLAKELHEKLSTVKIEHLGKRKIGYLSSGQKQRVGLAQALIGDPEVIIADEPMANLDPAGKQQITTLIRSLAHEDSNRAFFVSTHILAEAETLSDRIIILNEGKIVSDKPLDELRENYSSQAFFVNVSDRELLQQALSKNSWIQGIKIVKGGIEIKTSEPEELFRELPKVIAARGLSLLMFRPARSQLESLFFESTKINQLEGEQNEPRQS